jgi:hypothetical protein
MGREKHRDREKALYSERGRERVSTVTRVVEEGLDAVGLVDGSGRRVEESSMLRCDPAATTVTLALVSRFLLL